MSPKVIADLMVLTTREAEMIDLGGDDFFSKVESHLIRKMGVMTLDDLINLLWSALSVGKGSDLFYEKLEKEMARRLRSIKDEQFETLLTCF